MGAREQGGAGPVISMEFEVFGHVQGCYFTKYCRDEANRLGLGGWVKNSKKGTIVGKMQGERVKIDEMVSWLSNRGSPGCQIDHCDLYNYEYLAKPEFRGFSIRF